MNFFNLHYSRARRAMLMSLLSLGILSCGSETIISAGISGTGIVFGSISGFGSIIINGVHYNVDNASFEVNGDTTATQDNLAIGMVVKLNVTTYDDGSAVADSVFYDESVEGPITDEPAVSLNDINVKEFTVLGQAVSINALTTNFKSDQGVNFGFDNIHKDDAIEVSGFVDQQSGAILATHVELKGSLQNDDNEVQIHGVIENLALDKSSFTINGVQVDSSQITGNDLQDINLLANGLLVEVKGVYQAGMVLAEQIEGENDVRQEITDSEGFLDLEGIISNFVSSSEFAVNGIQVNLDTMLFSAQILSLLEDGVKVEVEGEMVNGVLQAVKLEVDGEDSNEED